MSLLDLDRFPAYDGSIPIDVWKHRRRQALRRAEAEASPLLRHRGPDGEPLYRLSPSYHLVRTHPLTGRIKRQVKERDGHACVWCGSTKNLEVDHIVRYVDGGPNTLENLRTLCYPCHGSRGGR